MAEINSFSGLPVDNNSQPIQVLAPVSSTAVVAATSATSARVTIPVTSKIIQISNTQDVWAKFGDNTVTAVAATAGNVLFLAGERALKVPDGATSVAFVRASADGVASVFNLN